MVVLSIALSTKNGKTLVARQFVEMTRIRIEGLLAAFPKLLGSDSKQHTFIETESVRYVYQPMEHIYLLLITNRASNIVEDLETLRLLSKVIPDIIGTSTNLNEEKILEHAYELIFAFDEIITAGGYREPFNLEQIRTFLEMESHEEKLHNMIKTTKMEQARDQAKDAARVIMENKQRGTHMAGIGGGQSAESTNGASRINDAAMEKMLDDYKKATPAPAAASRAPIKGMDILAKGDAKNKSLFDALVKEEKLAPILTVSTNKASTASAEVVNTAVQHPIMLQSVEKVTASLTRDGDVTNVEVKGNLTLTATDDEVALCAIQLSVDNTSNAFTFNTHPKVNKALYDKNQMLVMKDTKTGFPSGRPVGILRWSNSQGSSDFIPITVNCWPEEESKNRMLVTIDYSAASAGRMPLHNVKIHIPIHSVDAPVIKTIDGRYKHNKAASEMVWEVDLIDDSNMYGNLEFTVNEKDADSFFPIKVEFSSQQLYCNIDVVSVKTLASGADPLSHTGANAMFGYTKTMTSDEYTIE